MSFEMMSSTAELIVSGMAANTPIFGKIEKIFPTYGFAISNEGQRFFFHFGTCLSKPECLQVGDDVEFFLGQDAKSGRLHAQRVKQIPLGGQTAILRSPRSTDPFKYMSVPLHFTSSTPLASPATILHGRTLSGSSKPLPPVPLPYPHAVASSESGFSENGAPNSPAIMGSGNLHKDSGSLQAMRAEHQGATVGICVGSGGGNGIGIRGDEGVHSLRPPVRAVGVVLQAPTDYSPLARGKIGCLMNGAECDLVEFSWIALKFPQERCLISFGVRVQMLIVPQAQTDRWEARQVVPIVPLIKGLVSAVNLHTGTAAIELAHQAGRLGFPLKFYLGDPKDIKPNVPVQFIIIPSPKGELASRLTVLPEGSVSIYETDGVRRRGRLFVPPPQDTHPGVLVDMDNSDNVRFWTGDWAIKHSFRRGDVFQYKLRLDRRTNQRSATEIEFLPELSFRLSGEARERGRVVFVESPNGVWVQCDDTRPKKSHQSQQLKWNDVTGLVWVGLMEFVDKGEQVGLPTIGTLMDITVTKAQLDPKLRGQRAVILRSDAKPKLTLGIVEKVPESLGEVKGLIRTEEGHPLTFKHKDIIQSPVVVGDRVCFFCRSTREGGSRGVNVKKMAPAACDGLRRVGCLTLETALTGPPASYMGHGGSPIPSAWKLQSVGVNVRGGEVSPAESGYSGSPTDLLPPGGILGFPQGIIGIGPPPQGKLVIDERKMMMVGGGEWVTPPKCEVMTERDGAGAASTGFAVDTRKRLDGSTDILIELSDHTQLVMAKGVMGGSGWKRGDRLSMELGDVGEEGMTLVTNIRKLPTDALTIGRVESGVEWYGKVCKELEYRHRNNYGGVIEITDEQGASGFVRFTLLSLRDLGSAQQMVRGRGVYFRDQMIPATNNTQLHLAVDVTLA